MTGAFVLITLGGIMLYSAWHGVSIAEALKGELKPLSSKGGEADIETGVITGAVSDIGSGVDAILSKALPGGGGARGLVTSLFGVAKAAGGSKVFVVSAARPGSTTSSGNTSDHSSDDANRAARDFAVRGVDAIVGPPHPALDKAVVAIGKALGRDYKAGGEIVDTFTYKGMRVQIIWRTPAYGGHMGHIHVGAHKV